MIRTIFSRLRGLFVCPGCEARDRELFFLRMGRSVGAASPLPEEPTKPRGIDPGEKLIAERAYLEMALKPTPGPRRSPVRDTVIARELEE